MTMVLKKNIVRTVLLTLSILLVLLVGAVYIGDYYKNIKLIVNTTFFCISFGILIYLLPKILKDNRLKKFILLIVVIVSVFFILNSFMFDANRYDVMAFLFLPIVYTSFFYFCKRGSKVLFRMIENVIVVNACISVPFWIMSNIGLKFNTNAIVYWGSTNGVSREIPGYFGISFVSQTIKLGNSLIIRNSSFFLEAPLYAYVLVIALLIELFIIPEKKNNFKTYIILTTMLTTISTIGIIISVLAISYYYLFVYKDSFTIGVEIRKIMAIIVAIIIVYVALYNKVIVSDSSSALSSTHLRTDDFKACFLAFMHHPFIGNGLNNVNTIIENMNPIRFPNYTGLSTGLMTALAYGGIYLLLFYLAPLIISIKCSKRLFGLGLFTFLLTLLIVGYEVYLYIILSSYLFSMFLKNEE